MKCVRLSNVGTKTPKGECWNDEVRDGIEGKRLLEDEREGLKGEYFRVKTMQTSNFKER